MARARKGLTGENESALALEYSPVQLREIRSRLLELGARPEKARDALRRLVTAAQTAYLDEILPVQVLREQAPPDREAHALRQAVRRLPRAVGRGKVRHSAEYAKAVRLLNQVLKIADTLDARHRFESAAKTPVAHRPKDVVMWELVDACADAYELATGHRATVSKRVSGRGGAFREFVCAALPRTTDGKQRDPPDGIVERVLAERRTRRREVNRAPR